MFYKRWCPTCDNSTTFSSGGMSRNPDQDRLNLIGPSSAEVSQQLQFLLTGIAVMQLPTRCSFDRDVALIPMEDREIDRICGPRRLVI